MEWVDGPLILNDSGTRIGFLLILSTTLPFGNETRNRSDQQPQKEVIQASYRTWSHNNGRKEEGNGVQGQENKEKNRRGE